jgi:ABC-type multidrug transport system ATPase subunit
MRSQEAALVARGLELHTRQGRVFGPISFEAQAGSVTAVLGSSGSGKTSLLLALTARMRATRGSASVCGLDVARDAAKVRQVASLGLIAGVNDLEPGLTVLQHVAEQRLIVGRARRSEADVLDAVGLHGDGQIRARNLSAEQRLRLGLALALVGQPRVVVIDDLDRDLTAEQVASVGRTLRSLADDGLTLLVACLDQSSAGFADSTVWATAQLAEFENVDTIAEEAARALV